MRHTLLNPMYLRSSVCTVVFQYCLYVSLKKYKSQSEYEQLFKIPSFYQSHIRNM